MMRLALVVMVLVGACAPSYQADIDTVLAAHHTEERQIAAPGPLQPQPWKVGQWTLYKVTRNDDVGYIDVSVSQQDECGIWIHQITQNTKHRLDVKTCYKAMPSLTGKKLDLELVQVVILTLDENSKTVDFREPKNAGMRELMQSYLTSFPFEDWRDSTSLLREDIDVPAGHFTQSVRSTGKMQLPSGTSESTTWSHPEVPLSGAIKSSSDNGTELVLLAYGQTR